MATMTSDEYVLLADQVREHRKRLDTAEQQLRSMAYRAAARDPQVTVVISPDGQMAKLLRRYADELAELVSALHGAARNLGRRARDAG